MTLPSLSNDVRALLEAVSTAGGKEGILPVSAAMSAARRKEEQKRLEEKQKEDARQAKMAAELNGADEPVHLVGEMIRDQGIFIGRFEVFSLREAFNLFAAPQDMPETMQYPEAVKAVSELKDYHGHDGAYYKDAKQLEEALLTWTYDGGWIIPSCPMLCKALNHMNKGALKGGFRKAAAAMGDLSSHPERYWSSTVREQDGWVNTVDFLRRSSGYKVAKDSDSFNCRPVRLAPVNG